MRFEESGLPATPLVQQAFYYAHAKFFAEHSEKLRKLITEGLNEQLADMGKALERAFKEKKLSEAQYEIEKKKLEKMREKGPQLVEENVEENVKRLFKKNVVGRAQEMKESSTSPVVVALLADAMRSVKDYFEIEQKFGAPIAKTLMEIQHMNLYPREADALLEKADPLARRVYMVSVAIQLEGAQKMLKMMKTQFPKGIPAGMISGFDDAEVLFGHIKAAYGSHPDLDRRLVTTFNSVAKDLRSSYRIEIGNDNKPLLIKDSSPPPSDPPKKSGDKKKDDGPNFGDVF